MEMKIERGGVMQSKMEQGSGFGNGDQGSGIRDREHETKWITEHETRGGMGSGMGI